MPITHASQVVLVAAESLLDRLGLERAVAVIDDLPDGVVLNHIVDVLLCFKLRGQLVYFGGHLLLFK